MACGYVFETKTEIKSCGKDRRLKAGLRVARPPAPEHLVKRCPFSLIAIGVKNGFFGVDWFQIFFRKPRTFFWWTRPRRSEKIKIEFVRRKITYRETETCGNHNKFRIFYGISRPRPRAGLRSDVVKKPVAIGLRIRLVPCTHTRRRNIIL